MRDMVIPGYQSRCGSVAHGAVFSRTGLPREIPWSIPPLLPVPSPRSVPMPPSPPSRRGAQAGNPSTPFRRATPAGKQLGVNPSSSMTAPLRHRNAPLRAPVGRHHQGHRAPLLEHAWPPGGATLRLGLPRPTHRSPLLKTPSPAPVPAPSRQGRRCLQRAVSFHGADLRRRMAPHGDPHGAMGRFR